MLRVNILSSQTFEAFTSFSTAQITRTRVVISKGLLCNCSSKFHGKRVTTPRCRNKLQVVTGIQYYLINNTYGLKTEFSMGEFSIKENYDKLQL